jgi:hypothetical protein
VRGKHVASRIGGRSSVRPKATPHPAEREGVPAVGGTGSYAWAATVQRDGKLIAAGSGAGDFALARYTK